MIDSIVYMQLRSAILVDSYWDLTLPFSLTVE